jgi:hypothetical protein
MRKTLAVLAVIVASPLLAAPEPPLTIVDTVMVNARIEAIDHDARELTLVDGRGDSATVQLGPEIEGFDRLKVGDTVAFRYYESIAYAIRKPDQPRVLPSTSGEAVGERGQGANPGATLSRQQTATDDRERDVECRRHRPHGRRPTAELRPFRQTDVERRRSGT